MGQIPRFCTSTYRYEPSLVRLHVTHCRDVAAGVWRALADRILAPLADRVLALGALDTYTQVFTARVFIM